ncbi:chaplin [Streptomyces sp. SYSU K21746]
MRQVRRNGLVAAMITGTALAGAGYAHADSDADGGAAGSPGLLSGNTVQVPVHVPVNVCGNTVNVVGLLNPAAGNSCSNASHSEKPGNHGRHAKPGHAGQHRPGTGGAVAEGRGKDSPGVLSGNSIQLPVDVPVNVTGNSVNVIGIGNAAVGNSSSNTPDTPRPRPERPAPVTPPKEQPVRHTPPKDTQLAHTGTDALAVAVPTSAALLLGGALLYRRSRAARH